MARSESRQHRRPTSAELSHWFFRVQAREAGALQHLLAIYRPLLLTLAGRKLKGRVRAKVAPSDIVQSTVWAATQHFEAKKFHTRQEFLAWVLTILKHTAADERRRFQDAQKRDISRERSLDGPEARAWLRKLSFTLTQTSDDPSQAVVHVDDVLRALDTLPPHYQLVIRLRYFERLRFEDIGRKFNRSADAVRVLHNRALQKLRATLVTRQLS